MNILSSIFQLSAGVGLFLFAMYLLEESLKNLSGRNFKLFLQRITKNRVGAVTGGALVTAVLQSSSMVSLMVLAFVGAGVFTMKNALAIILGANLGTTIDSWMVASLGFKINIEVVAYPAVCIGGLLLILFSKRKTIKYTSWFLFGFGLLFIGLSFMKTAMEAQVKLFDFAEFTAMPTAFFLAVGFLITLLVQSSSVTMALTLTALHVGAIDFTSAAAVVLGSETGTTIKILLSAVGGNAAKKRVVLGNLVFNVFLTVAAFLFLKPILMLITDVFGITNPLIALVTFSSLVNLGSIIVFLPLLDFFAKILEKCYTNTDTSAAAFIGNAVQAEPETALDLARRETDYFIHNVMLFNLSLFDIDTKSLLVKPEFDAINEKKKFDNKTQEEKYEFLKLLQGELQAFYISFRLKLAGEQLSQLSQLMSAGRSAMRSAKSLNDISSNISNLKRSSKDIKFDLFNHHKKETADLYYELDVLITKNEQNSFAPLKETLLKIETNYSETRNDFYKEAQNAPLEDMDLTIVINFNQALFTSSKAILMAAKDLLLDEEKATEFNEIPVYIT